MLEDKIMFVEEMSICILENDRAVQFKGTSYRDFTHSVYFLPELGLTSFGVHEFFLNKNSFNKVLNDTIICNESTLNRQLRKMFEIALIHNTSVVLVELLHSSGK